MGRLTWKVIALLIINDMADSFAQLFMKKGLPGAAAGSVNLNNVMELVSRSAASPYLWIGIAIYLSGFFMWIVVLSRMELSIAMPIGSVCYLLTPLLALIFLHEKISTVRWLGIALIAVGIYFVSESKRKSTKVLKSHV